MNHYRALLLGMGLALFAGAAPSLQAIELDPAERDYLAQHPSFTLCVDPHLLPFEELDARGNYRGLFADFLALIARNGALQFEVVKTKDYFESRQRFAAGECALLVSSELPEKAGGGQSSLAFYTAEVGYVVPRHSQYDFNALMSQRVGVVNDIPLTGLLQAYPQLRVAEVDSLHIGLDAVVSGDLQALMAPLSILDYHLNEAGSEHLHLGGSVGEHIHYVLQVNAQQRALLPILNKAISAITVAERANIIHKWLHNDVKKEEPLAYIVAFLLALLVLLYVVYRYHFLRRSSEQLQHTLEDSEARFQRMADNAPDMLFRMSLPEGRYEYVSPAALTIFGYTQEEFLATPRLIDTLAPAEWQGYLRGRWEALLRGILPAGCEYPVRHKSGEIRWVSHRCTLLKNAAGEPVALEGIVSDMTERKEVEAALQRSERRMRAIIESSPDWVWEVDAQGVYTYASPRVEELLGYPPEEVVGKTPFDLMAPAETARVGKLFGEIVAAKRPFHNLENTNRHKDGHEVVLETSGIPIFDDRGELLGYRGVDRDISQRKANEHQLRVERDFIDTVFEAAGNVIAIMDVQGRFVRFNRAAEQLTGYSREEVVGHMVWESVIPDEQIERVRGVFENLCVGKVQIAGEYENHWKTRDGQRRLLHWYNTVLYDEQGKVEYIVTLGYDVTAVREAEQEQERLQRELQQAQKMESLGQLTGGIAHDFNNLLGIINGYAGLALDNCERRGEEKLAGYMRHLVAAGERAASMVAQMLAFSRVDPSNDAPIMMAPLVKEDLKMLRSTLPTTIEMQSEIDTSLPPVVMNPTHLHQILLNLVINARDAMQGRGNLKVRLGWARGLDTVSTISHKPVRGDWVELSVSDSGSGIESEILDKIFNPFFTTKEVGKGTGMGLAVIYGIMETHQGHILVESSVGKGSTFRMLFPPHRASSGEVAVVESGSAALPTGNGAEILLVDDEVSLGIFMAEMLQSYGYRAHAAASSHEALALFEKEPQRFAMVITDQTMPQMTGLELITRLRDIRPQLPVVLCSGYSDHIDAVRAKQLDIPYFSKPVEAERLLVAIAEQLKEHTV